MSGMQDDEKIPDDLGTAHEVILVQSDTLVKQKEKIEKLNTSLQEALAEIRFLRSGKKREKFINADQLLLEFPEARCP
jgi:prefoldin subunit 5